MVQRSSARVLSARRLAGEAYSHWFANLPAWAVASALPFLLLLVIDYAALQTLAEQSTQSRPQEAPFAGGLRGILKSLVDAIIYTFFAVAWHRQILLAEAPRVIPAVGTNHVRFLLWFLAVFLMTLFVLFTVTGLFRMVGGVSVVSALGGLLGGLLSVYFSCRVCVIFPDVATGGRLGLVRAWEMTRGEVWPLCWAFVLVMIPIVAAAIALMAILGVSLMAGATPQSAEEVMSGPAYWIFSIVSVLLFLASITVSVGVASNAYRALAVQRQAGSGPLQD